MTRTDAFAPILRALERCGAPSSDFDLNADVGPAPGRKLRDAGVLLALQPSEDGLKLILTKRNSALKHHPGQIAFPGGKVDPGDAGAIGAALREAQEEIGLAPTNVAVLGTLPPHETVTGFRITPVIGRIEADFDQIREVLEVDEIFTVPFAHIVDPARYHIESRLWRGTERRYYVVPYGPYYIWGATARILRALADRMADR